MTVAATAQSVREHVAWACRILALEGFSDLTLGHVSARPAGGETIYIKRKGLALDEVGPEDVVEVDDPSAALHLETVIHTEIYASRPDVGAIVHAHPPYVTAFGATTAELQLLTHDAVLFADGVAYFEETSELITEEEQGRAVAEALGHRRAVILRNHGVVVADVDVRWAVLSSITLERAVRLQAIATGLGELRPIARDDAERMRADKYQDSFVDEYWAAWIRNVRSASADHSMPPE